MIDRGREFIGNEFTRLLKDWYRPTEGLAPADVQVHGGDARLVIGKEMTAPPSRSLAMTQDTLWGLVTRNPTASLCGLAQKSSPLPYLPYSGLVLLATSAGILGLGFTIPWISPWLF
ncbi:hypothetical protein DSO57_1012322 [Entomophthora muscae]|uniref:Uncharacterized protein n=1 Tax=Entomophthora muscae TaxID=34485 RepID=A0ACC2U3S5_9FUNG|nr:hypothetical protein DSO57_1012322 [Entomophthora muscae]